MLQNVKLLIFDIDDTLSFGENPIENDISKTLCDFEKSGFQLCFASGKDYYYLKALSRGMGVNNPWLIAENGR